MVIILLSFFFSFYISLRSQLDVQETLDKYPPSFGVVMSLKVTEETPDNTYTEPWEKMHVEKLSPYACFYSKEEYWKVYEEYGKTGSSFFCHHRLMHFIVVGIASLPTGLFTYSKVCKLYLPASNTVFGAEALVRQSH